MRLSIAFSDMLPWYGCFYVFQIKNLRKNGTDNHKALKIAFLHDAFYDDFLPLYKEVSHQEKHSEVATRGVL